MFAAAWHKAKVSPASGRGDYGDRVADQVMRMPAPEVSVAVAPPQISSQCAEGAGKVQRSLRRAQDITAEAPASVPQVLRSPGEPLDTATRGFFEPRFGQELLRGARACR